MCLARDWDSPSPGISHCSVQVSHLHPHPEHQGRANFSLTLPQTQGEAGKADLAACLAPAPNLPCKKKNGAAAGMPFTACQYPSRSFSPNKIKSRLRRRIRALRVQPASLGQSHSLADQTCDPRVTPILSRCPQEGCVSVGSSPWPAGQAVAFK